MSLKDAIAAKKQRTSQNKEVALQEIKKETTKRLNVNVPASRLQQFKAKAAIEGTDMSTLVNHWIQAYLKASKNIE